MSLISEVRAVVADTRHLASRERPPDTDLQANLRWLMANAFSFMLTWKCAALLLTVMFLAWLSGYDQR